MAGNLRGVARPVGRMRGLFKSLHGSQGSVALEKAIDDEIATDALARLLTAVIETERANNSGRVDMRTVAARVLAELRRHPK